MIIDRRQMLVGTTALIASPFVMRKAALGQPAPRVRRDVTAMAANDPFFSDYADAIAAMHKLDASDGRNWRNQALIHLNHCPHGGYSDAPDFIVWHRNYILYYEEICGKLIGKPGFALPYWNWQRGIGAIPDPFYKLDGLNVVYWNDPSNASSPNWNGGEEVVTKGTRLLAEGQGVKEGPRGGTFSDPNIESIQSTSDFPNYTNKLETQPHNVAHMLVGGTTGHMGDGMSPLDPIFWLHHCNVDRLGAAWQAAGNTIPALGRDYGGQFTDADGQTISGSLANSDRVIDIGNLGYVYEQPDGSIVGSPPVAEAVPPAMMMFAERAPAVIGTVDARTEVVAQRTASVAVPVEGLGAALFAAPRNLFTLDRLGAPAVATRPAQIIARIGGLDLTSAARSLLVNVFVNRPEADPETPSTDPHYVTTFGLFGLAAHGGGHHGHDGEIEILVEVGETLRRLAALGLVEGGAVSIQLVPVPVEGPTDASFSFGSITLFAT